jgi:hypothetical protein
MHLAQEVHGCGILRRRNRQRHPGRDMERHGLDGPRPAQSDRWDRSWPQRRVLPVNDGMLRSRALFGLLLQQHHDGVSCRSAANCTAVGYSSSSTKFASNAETWNGKDWTVDHTPNPSGATRTYLYGVVCASTTACTAVGSSGSTTVFSSLVEVSAGTKWKIHPTPTP